MTHPIYLAAEFHQAKMTGVAPFEVVPPSRLSQSQCSSELATGDDFDGRFLLEMDR